MPWRIRVQLGTHRPGTRNQGGEFRWQALSQQRRNRPQLSEPGAGSSLSRSRAGDRKAPRPIPAPTREPSRAAEQRKRPASARQGSEAEIDWRVGRARRRCGGRSGAGGLSGSRAHSAKGHLHHRAGCRLARGKAGRSPSPRCRADVRASDTIRCARAACCERTSSWQAPRGMAPDATGVLAA